MPQESKQTEKLKLHSITLTTKTVIHGMPLETIKNGSNGLQVTMSGKHAMIRREGHPGVVEVYPEGITNVQWLPEATNE